MNINHEDGCGCVICSEMTRNKPTAEEERLMMVVYGWYAHLNEDDPFVATGFSYHTHGFDKSLGHLDLQIVLPLRRDKCHGIAKTIYDQIKASAGKFIDGDETLIPHQDGSEFPVRFIKVREGDRDVLRVILPNPRGELEPKHVAEDDEPEYALQWTVSAV